MSKFQVRPIAPHAVEIGMTVAVNLPPHLGVSITYSGRVHSIRQRGESRQYLAQEGAVLFTLDKYSQPQYKISLLGRDPEPQTQFEGISFS